MKQRHGKLPQENFVVEVSNVNVVECIGNHELTAEIVELLHNRLVVVFRNQKLTPDQLLAFSKQLGPTEPCPDQRYALTGFNDILVVGKIYDAEQSQEALFTNGGIEWHYDYAQTERPALASILYAVTVPPSGGDTLYADTRSAYEALPTDTKEQLRHAYATYSYQQLNAVLDNSDPQRKADLAPQILPVKHPIVQEHPITGRPAILLAPEIMASCDGIPENLIDELLDHCTHQKFVYRHVWQKGDLVLHDNRATIHSATEMTRSFERVMYRTTIMPTPAGPSGALEAPVENKE